MSRSVMTRIAALLAMGVLISGPAAGSSVVLGIPTGNQLAAGEVYAVASYLAVDTKSLVPPLNHSGLEFVQVQCMSVGLTDQVEVSATRTALDLPSEWATPQTSWGMSLLLERESRTDPSVVIGARDLSRVSEEATYYLAAAKTLNAPMGGPPRGPIVRAYLSLGTGCDEVLGEKRYDGLFGGVEATVISGSPEVSVLGFYDGQDVVTGIRITPERGWPTIGMGTFGDHYWFDLGYRFNSKGYR